MTDTVTPTQADRALFARVFGVLPSASPIDQRTLRDIAQYRLDAIATQAAEIARLREEVGKALHILRYCPDKQRRAEGILCAALSAQPSEQEGGE